MIRQLPAYPIYLLIQGVFGFGFITFATLSTLYRIETVGLNPFQLVLVGTALELAAFSFEIPTGILADLYSRRLSVIVGMFLFGIGFMFEGLLPYFVTVMIAQVIWGAGWTFISGAPGSLDCRRAGRGGIGKVYLRGAQINQVGLILGVPLAVVLGSVSLALPMVVGGAIFVGLGIVLLVVMPGAGLQSCAAWGTHDVRLDGRHVPGRGVDDPGPAGADHDHRHRGALGRGFRGL
ncbi:MAG: hypothetical protein R2849_04725 [Thermomicrobiales bacterium]